MGHIRWKSTIPHIHQLDKLELNGGKLMFCWWQKIAFHNTSICQLGLFQHEVISISSHLQVIFTVEQFAECVCVLWLCGNFQGLEQHVHLKKWQAVTGVLISNNWEKTVLSYQNICTKVVLSCLRHQPQIIQRPKYFFVYNMAFGKKKRFSLRSSIYKLASIKSGYNNGLMKGHVDNLHKSTSAASFVLGRNTVNSLCVCQLSRRSLGKKPNLSPLKEPNHMSPILFFLSIKSSGGALARYKIHLVTNICN